MTTFHHFGLYFTPEHVQIARKEREREPFRAAWEMLHNQGAPPDSLAAIQWNGFRFRFDNDPDAGQKAVDDLETGTGLYTSNGSSNLDSLMTNAILANCFELVRDHAAWTPESQTTWLERFAAQVESLNRVEANLGLVEQLWRGLVNVTAGILLEDDARLAAGTEVYRRTIENEIRPEGYLPLAVERNDGGSLYRQILSVGALVLMAEAASHVGIDLWGYNARGISVLTAASYLIYYYYYPDQWRWDTISEDEAKPLFQEHGAFLEMLNRRARPKDLKLLLDDLRPLYSLTAGGLTTLSHGLPTRRGLFG